MLTEFEPIQGEETHEPPKIDSDLLRYRAAKILHVDPQNPDSFPNVRFGETTFRTESLTEWFEGHPYKVWTISTGINGLTAASRSRYRFELKYAWDRPIPKNIPIVTYELQGIVYPSLVILTTTTYEDGTKTLVIRRSGKYIDPTDEEVEKIENAFDLRK